MRAVRRPCVLPSSQGENDDPALTAPVGRPLVSAVTGTNGKTTVAAVPFTSTKNPAGPGTSGGILWS